MAHYPNPQPDEKEVSSRNLWIARRLLAAFNWEDTEIVKEFIDPQIINNSPHPASTLKEEDEIVEQHRFFPDLHFREEVSVAEGDMVFIGWQMTGTHLGEALEHAYDYSSQKVSDRQASGLQLTYYGGEVLRLKNGKVIEHWDHFTKPRLEGLAKLGILDDEMVAALDASGLL